METITCEICGRMLNKRFLRRHTGSQACYAQERKNRMNIIDFKQLANLTSLEGEIAEIFGLPIALPKSISDVADTASTVYSHHWVTHDIFVLVQQILEDLGRLYTKDGHLWMAYYAAAIEVANRMTEQERQDYLIALHLTGEVMS